MALFSFVKIVVADLAAMEAFYTGALGFTVQNRIDTPDFREVMLAQKAGAFTLVLYHNTDGRALSNGNGWGPLGFIVRDCAKDHAAALTKGAAEVRAPAVFGGMTVSFISDPEGHEIELLQLPAAA
jgi:catechol 2,3-dioxygenase-like lactoylglutathione lyase family enzyme